MNNDRHALLRKAFGNGAAAAQVTLFQVARAHAVTVDDLVQAGLGRGGSDAAARAATAIKAKVPDFFKPLDAEWPYVCPACSKDATRLNHCFECKTAKVCDSCLGTYGCPACAAKAEALRERRKTDNAASEQNRKWLQRQMAQPLPEEEPSGEPAHPEEPPPVVHPPDAVFPEPVPESQRHTIPGVAPVQFAVWRGREEPPPGWPFDEAVAESPNEE